MKAELVFEAKAALDALADADITGRDRAGLDAVLADLSCLRRLVAAVEIDIARRSRELAAQGRSECAEGVLGEAGRRSGREARAAAERERACTELPCFETALGAGEVTTGHLDALAAATRGLDNDTKTALGDYAEDLLAAAAVETVTEFSRTCRTLVRSLDTDDATTRLERQRAQRKVARWVDRTTGMWHLHAELDPLAGARIDAALDAVTRAARTAAAKGEDFSWDHAAADTLVELITGARTVERRVPDVAVHIDWTTLTDGLHEHSLCETVDGTPLPVSTVRRLCCQAEIFPVVLSAEGVVLDTGHSQRLANRAQRRALRAMYRTCAHPHCDVTFDRCEIHHVLAWEHHGPTDLANLLPLCGLHHHLVHEGGWTLHLDPDRTITLTRPDGTTHYRGSTTNRTPNRAPTTSGAGTGPDARTHHPPGTRQPPAS